MKKIVLFSVMFLLSVSVFAAKIDLAISSSDVTVSPPQPKAGDSVTVTVKVHSQGTKASKASVVKLKITKGTNKVFSQKNSIPAIAVGESYDTVFNVGALQEGTYTLLVKVDPANAIPETNEGNNTVTLTLVVSQGGSSGGASQVAANIIATTFNTSFGAVDNISQGGGSQYFALYKQISRYLNIAKNPEDTINCSKSGYFEMNYSLDSMGRLSTTEFNYHDCEDWIDQSQNTYSKLNGVMTMNISYLSDSILSPDFNTISQILIKTGDGDPNSDTKPDYSFYYYQNGNLYDSMTSDYTMTVSIFEWAPDGSPTGMGVYINGAMTYINTAQGVNYAMTFNNLHYDMGISGTDNDMTIEIVIAGTSSCIYDNNQSKKITVTYNNVNITAHQYQSYEEFSINGSMDVQSPCYTGSVSIQTLNPIVQQDDANCPNSGKIKVTAGNKTATVTFNSDGSVSVDENSDGSVDYTYPNCEVLSKYPC